MKSETGPLPMAVLVQRRSWDFGGAGENTTVDVAVRVYLDREQLTVADARRLWWELGRVLQQADQVTASDK